MKVTAARMAIIASPPTVPTTFHHGTSDQTSAHVLNSRAHRPPFGPSRSSFNVAFNIQPLSKITNGEAKALTSPRLSDGDSAGQAVNPHHNDEISQDQLELPRTRIENQPVTHQPKPKLVRTKTEWASKPKLSPPPEPIAEEHIRHGWQEQYNSSEYLTSLSQVSANRPKNEATDIILF